MPEAVNEEPILVIPAISSRRSFIFTATLLGFPIFLTIIAIPDWTAVFVIWIVFLALYGGIRIIFWRIAMKERIEFYETEFKLIGMNVVLEGFGSLSERQATQKVNYSQITRFKEISDFGVKKTLFYGNGAKYILSIPKGSKKKELGGLHLADWIKTKANLPTKSSD